MWYSESYMILSVLTIAGKFSFSWLCIVYDWLQTIFEAALEPLKNGFIRLAGA